MKLFQSHRGLFVVCQEGSSLRATVDVLSDGRLDDIRELVELGTTAVQIGAASTPLWLEGVSGTRAVITARHQRSQHVGRVPWNQARELIVGLCLLAKHIHPASHYVGPPSRELVFGEDILTTPFAALRGYIHRIEAGMTGVAMQMGVAHITPELNDRSPAADVFYLSQFLVELLTGREVFAGRTTDQLAYLLRVRSGPSEFLERWSRIATDLGLPQGLHEVLRRGMSANPQHRPTVNELSDLLWNCD